MPKTLVVGLRLDNPAQSPHVEPVVVDRQEDGRTLMILNDGTVLDFDTLQLDLATRVDAYSMGLAA